MFLAHTESACVTMTHIYDTPLDVMLHHHTLPDHDPGGMAEIPDLPGLPDLEIAVIAFTSTETGPLRPISALQPPPKTMKQLLTHPDAREYMAAARAELDHINKTHTWTPINRDTVTDQILPLKWVFTQKSDEKGNLLKFKARIVVRGDLQYDIVSKRDLYAQTAAIQHFRVLLAYAAQNGYDIHQMDAITAFLQSLLDAQETIYVEPPPGFPELADQVYLLRRPLYGLRIAPKSWYDTCRKKLITLGFQPIPEEPCLYQHGQTLLYVYVDDLLLCGPTDQLNQLRPRIDSVLNVRHIGPATQFLGMEIKRLGPHHIQLTQTAYIDKLVQKFEVPTPRTTPTIPIRIPTKDLNPPTTKAKRADIKRMQRLTGSLLYLSLNTRGDIAKATHFCAENMSNPSRAHLDAAIQIIQYAAATRDRGLNFNGSDTVTPLIRGATDAAFADDKETRRSSHGYVLFLCGAPVFWACKKQTTVATSTTEAELTALTYGVRELFALLRLLTQISFPLDSSLCVTILCDNEQAVEIANSRTNSLTTRLRHVDIQQSWIRDVLAHPHLYPPTDRIRIAVEWVPSQDMPADGLTKLLPNPAHQRFVSLWGYQPQIE